MKNIASIPDNDRRRIVIIGGGFAGLQLAKSLKRCDMQIVLIDRNNYHQFQPLFYQVATSGLEPSAISFPLRKLFQNQKHIHVRIASLGRIEPDKKCIVTDIGTITYDHLVLAVGADTNYFGNANIQEHSIPMKSLSEAIYLRNLILTNFENALNQTDPAKIESLMNFVIVGGGPTGTELAGAIAEMKNNILPKDYPELDFSMMKIHLLEAGDKVLNGYSETSSKKGKEYLEKLGVKVSTATRVNDYNGKEVKLATGDVLLTETLIWAAGVRGNTVVGLNDESFGRGGRLIVDRYNRVAHHEEIYALGDIALMQTEKYERGHPQIAQVAMHQGKLLAKNFKRFDKGKDLEPFTYKNKGSLATVGRNLAVADLPRFSFQGFFAWILWLFVHLISIIGAKNRIMVFINWAWSYFTYDQSLRLLIKPTVRNKS